jgi:hypothetical protein
VTRLLAACGAAASLLVLSGCAVTGTAVISPDDIVTIYGTISETPSADGTSPACERIRSSGLGLVVQAMPSAPVGSVGCQITGTVGIQAFAPLGYGVGLAHTGDGRYTLLAPAALFSQTPPADTLDVAITFPGTVLASDPAAKVDGSVVRWSAAPNAGEGLWVSSLQGGDLPPASLLGLLALGGLLFGLAASIVTLSLRRTLRRRAAAALAPAASEVDAEASEPVADDTSEWAPDADR